MPNNFPQNRVSDHRINLTLYKLDAVMDGGPLVDIDEDQPYPARFMDAYSESKALAEQEVLAAQRFPHLDTKRALEAQVLLASRTNIQVLFEPDLGSRIELTVTDDPQSARPDIETVIVAASRYEISRDISPSTFSLDQRSIQNMPKLIII